MITLRHLQTKGEMMFLTSCSLADLPSSVDIFCESTQGSLDIGKIPESQFSLLIYFLPVSAKSLSLNQELGTGGSISFNFLLSSTDVISLSEDG